MLDRIYSRYVVASAAALGVDFAIFMATLRVGLTPALAAATGYAAGIACHWLLSTRAVFVGQVAQKASLAFGIPQDFGLQDAVDLLSGAGLRIGPKSHGSLIVAQFTRSY